MERRQPVAAKRRVMPTGAVTFMNFKLIIRIAARQTNHSPVAPNFGGDGSEHNYRHRTVAANDRLLIFIFSRRAQTAIQ